MPKDSEVDEISRLKITAHSAGAWSAHEHERGGFVLYTDHAATVAELRAEVERLQEANHLYSFAMNTAGIDELKRRADEAERRVAELEANDRRYRFLREKVCIIGTEHLSYTKAVFEFVNLPYPTYVAPSAAYELDAAIDAITGADPT